MGNWKDIKILLVEDNSINAFVMTRFLEDTGAKITRASNGREAVERCIAGEFDIILMNIKMPVMDGFEATREIRKFNNEVRIIAHTNYDNIREKCIEGGFSDYIRKPFKKEDLIKIIEQNLEP